MMYMTGMGGMGDMIDLHNYKSNVGRDMNPDTMNSFGDNPTRVRTVPTRLMTMTSERLEEGSLEEGISMAKNLYELDPISDLVEGSSDYV